MRLGYQSTIGNGQIYFGREGKYRSQRCRIEWQLGKKSQNFSAKAWIFAGDCDNDLTFIFGFPWLFHVYFTICGIFKACTYKERQCGIATHNGAFWLYVLPYTNESSSGDPWYRKTYCFNFPWTLDHYETQVLTHDTPENAKSVYVVPKKGGFEKKAWAEREEAQALVSKTYGYRYVLKNGKVQERQATVYVDRMEWRARWWPIIRIRRVRTSINIHFNDEVGEKTGSYKGGCIGCGYTMLPGETPEATLRRMERERKF